VRRKFDNVITIAFAAVDGRQQENKERSKKDYIGRRRLDMAKMFSIEDWEKMTIEEVKMRWGNRRREIEEVEKRKREIEEKIEIRKKKKEERRKRAIRERRCFVCGIFGHIAHYYRNREEKRGLSMSQNKFEVLKDRVMQRGEGSGKETVKGRREILREERKKKTKVQKKDQGKKKEKKIDDEKMKEKKTEEKKEERKIEKRNEVQWQALPRSQGIKKKREEKIEEEKEVEM